MFYITQAPLATSVPTRPNRLGKAGMICAREKEKRSIVDRYQIACYRSGMPKKTTRKIPSIPTLIRDGYLMPEEADDPDQVMRCAMDWMDDFQEYELNRIMNDE